MGGRGSGGRSRWARRHVPASRAYHLDGLVWAWCGDAPRSASGLNLVWIRSQPAGINPQHGLNTVSTRFKPGLNLVWIRSNQAWWGCTVWRTAYAWRGCRPLVPHTPTPPTPPRLVKSLLVKSVLVKAHWTATHGGGCYVIYRHRALKPLNPPNPPCGQIRNGQASNGRGSMDDGCA